ncbi:tRNA guanosine-2'-O-methyltransferase [Stanieria cyanosphaera PCC 7437]|uniref:tRNA (guanosine(18)-2'-O)-methyltransferase n=1 Tax=Stanieria cyanosphaera (strain ATCC 29371 / PCC 7437) TaxID=111780 RepID=K9XVC6_STAC7|nr:tRNA (guanosine(18)-2'-O)-methyltransferase TrmH [Stanieria cyanosphaera]AFZ36019.1 tRNA guanosine-2'-O-methyltransferase [Stanieria cyanosphaera PCC 7437]
MTPERYQKFQQVLNRRQLDLTVITEDVHKPHNFSAIIRTCDAVGVFAIHAVNSRSSMPIYNQVAKGSEKWVACHTHTNIESAVSDLHQQGLKVYAAHLSKQALDYRMIDYTKPTAILLGAEKSGVTQKAADLVDGHIIIPMLGMVQSLNVSVAAAVILFEAQRQRLAAGLYERVHLAPDIYEQMMFEWSYPEVAASYRQQEKPYPRLGTKGEIIIS